MNLVPVVSDEQVEWLRVQRNRPELYKYFRQDAPITDTQQKKWWKNLNKSRVKLFIVEHNCVRVGYVGFNPFSQVSRTAEFGMFILPEYSGNGLGKAALRELLRLGFEEYRLSSIYSDCLDYPGEDRFKFYESVGFEAYPPEHQSIQYRKQGKMVKSTKFFMTQDKWGDIRGQDSPGQLEPDVEKEPAQKSVKKRGRPRLHPSKDEVVSFSK